MPTELQSRSAANVKYCFTFLGSWWGFSQYMSIYIKIKWFSFGCFQAQNNLTICVLGVVIVGFFAFV